MTSRDAGSAGDHDPDPADSVEPEAPVRRDFLSLLTVATAAVGACAFAWPFLDSLNSAATEDATPATVDVDLMHLAVGQQLVVPWRDYPVFVVRRDPEALQGLQEASVVQRLRDPRSAAHQQPDYATNWHRSIVPEFGVMVGICTHLGCVPRLRRDGYVCPCHGSRFDLAGRVFAGSPAAYNLPVPPHALSDRRLRIGENAAGSQFDFDDIQKI